MKTFVLTSLFCCLAGMAHSQITAYPSGDTDGKILKRSTSYSVEARALPDGEWQNLEVYYASVDIKKRRNTSFVEIDSRGDVEFRVTNHIAKYDSVSIRPLSRDVEWKCVNDSVLTFVAEPGMKLSLETNGDRYRNLHIFVNEPLKEILKPDGDDCIDWSQKLGDVYRKNARLIYFGPGVHRPKDLPSTRIRIPSNCTVYLAPGAVVNAQLSVDKAENVRIIGRGYICSPCEAIDITYSKNVEIDGVTIVNPGHYTVYGGQSDSIRIHNVKSLSGAQWGDGFDLMSCSNVDIDDCFIRTSDDCLAFYNHRWGFWGNSTNFTVRNTILWADVAHPINLGGHGDDMDPQGETLSNVLYENIDILECRESQPLYQGCLSIGCGDNNTVMNVTFRNIRIEDVQLGRLVNFNVLFNEKYNRVPGRGISNITLENVSYEGRFFELNPPVVTGYSEERCIDGVTFRNVTVNGKRIRSLEGFETNEYIKNVKFK